MGQIPRRRTAAEALRERRGRLARAELDTALADLLTGRSLTSAETPAWVDPTVRGFWNVHVDPAACLPDEAAPAELDAWIASLLAAEHGFAERILLWTPFPEPTWLECRTITPDWLARVRRATTDPWRFLAIDLSAVLVVTEEEYHFQAHVGRRP